MSRRAATASPACDPLQPLPMDYNSSGSSMTSGPSFVLSPPPSPASGHYVPGSGVAHVPEARAGLLAEVTVRAQAAELHAERKAYDAAGLARARDSAVAACARAEEEVNFLRSKLAARTEVGSRVYNRFLSSRESLRGLAWMNSCSAASYAGYIEDALAAENRYLHDMDRLYRTPPSPPPVPSTDAVGPGFDAVPPLNQPVPRDVRFAPKTENID